MRKDYLTPELVKIKKKAKDNANKDSNENTSSKDIASIETGCNYKLNIGSSHEVELKHENITNHGNNDILITSPNQQTMLEIGFVLDRNRPQQISF